MLIVKYVFYIMNESTIVTDHPDLTISRAGPRSLIDLSPYPVVTQHSEANTTSGSPVLEEYAKQD